MSIEAQMGPRIAFVSNLPLHTFRKSHTTFVCTRKVTYPSRRKRATWRAEERLYPEPEEEKRIDNPVSNQNQNQQQNENSGPNAFFNKLNETTKKRAANTSSTPLAPNENVSDPAATVIETTFSEPIDQVSVKHDYKKAASALWKLGWVTWWIQMILTVISGVILLFAFAFPGVNIRTSASAIGFILSGIGVFIAFISLIWTYSYTRLSLWLQQQPDRPIEIATARVVTRLRLGMICAIVGLTVSLIGLQAIVGTLLARLFSAGIATTPYPAVGAAPGAFTPNAAVVQPIDILVVQATANAMTALLAALSSTSWLRSRSRGWLSNTKANS